MTRTFREIQNGRGKRRIKRGKLIIITDKIDQRVKRTFPRRIGQPTVPRWRVYFASCRTSIVVARAVVYRRTRAFLKVVV